MKAVKVFLSALIISYSTFSLASGQRVGPNPSCARASTNPKWERPVEAEWSLTNANERSGIVNIYAHGSLKGLLMTLKLAGYYLAEEPGLVNNIKFGAAAAARAAARAAGAAERPLSKPFCGVDSEENSEEAIYNQFQKMPISIETVGCERQVAALQKDNTLSGSRHHLRIFNLHQFDENGMQVWGISAIRDSSYTLDRAQPQRLFLNHAVDPETDAERDVILYDMRVNGLLKAEETFPIRFSQPPPRNGAFSRDQKAVEILTVFSHVQEDKK